MAEEKKAEKEVKKRRPQAQKRDIQNERKAIANRAYRSEVNTAIRSFKSGDKKQLGTIFSLVDKGVKTGVIKSNKANRIKSRLTAK
jgi:small subunit ribosomal protein S20